MRACWGPCSAPDQALYWPPLSAGGGKRHQWHRNTDKSGHSRRIVAGVCIHVPVLGAGGAIGWIWGWMEGG